ncbi:phospholipase [Microbacterium sp.]|uniref:aggregation-promoting factor C-terminal-like domain-containing protein n=1 Tax=Microbacterium sp. TaxID=51671 RepID=UPI0025E4453A|nr:phospholipase [Microbacterium sp.]
MRLRTTHPQTPAHRHASPRHRKPDTPSTPNDRTPTVTPPATRRARHRATPRATRVALPVAAALLTVAAVGVPLGAASASAAAQPAGIVVQSPRPVDQDASLFVGIARSTSVLAHGKVDTTDLAIQIAQLDDSHQLPSLTVAAFTSQLRTTTANVAQKLAEYDAEQARKAEAARAAARAAAVQLASTNTPDGARATARSMAATRYGWGDGQFSCLASLWQKESGWNYRAYNPSGATGIPQALPGSKMASAGADWQTNAATQIAWGLDYIKRAYGSPCAAWGHSQAMNWY